MGDAPSPDATQFLADLHAGDRRAADRLLPLVHEELRRLAGCCLRHARADHALEPISSKQLIWL